MIAVAEDIQIELRFGLLSGALVSLYIFTEFLLGFHTTRLDIGAYSGYGASIIPFVVYFFALKRWRVERGGGFLVVRQGIRSGLFMGMITAVVLAGFMSLYTTVINPTFLDTSVTKIQRELESQGRPAGEIRDTIEYLRASNALPRQVAFILAGVTFEGILICAVLSYFLQRRPPVPDGLA